MLSTEIKRDDRGVDRCNRIVNIAVPNVPNDDTKGYHNTPMHCGMPIVQRISDGVKGCPRCDKEPAVGNVHPRTINSAGISLTQKELEECGVKTDKSLEKVSKPIIKKLKEAKKAVEAKVSKVKKDEVVLVVSLGSLESNADIAALLIKKASEALDALPVTNFAESKRLIKIQEKLESLVKV